MEIQQIRLAVDLDNVQVNLESLPTCVYLLKRARSLERWRKFLMYMETL